MAEMVPPWKDDQNLLELSRKWAGARHQAYLQSVGSFPATSEHPLQVSPEIETMRIQKLEPEQASKVLRLVFDLSRSFGLWACGRSESSWSVDAIAQFLQASQLPCLTGLWLLEDKGATHCIQRSSCNCLATETVCDYWREAIDGLVMGLGDSARYSRHRSYGHGDSECLDVIYDANEVDRRFGTVPLDMRWKLERLTSQLAQDGVVLQFFGFSEGSLFYQLDTQGRSPCGAGGALLRGVIEREIPKLFANVRPIDVTPVAVFRGPEH